MINPAMSLMLRESGLRFTMTNLWIDLYLLTLADNGRDFYTVNEIFEIDDSSTKMGTSWSVQMRIPTPTVESTVKEHFIIIHPETDLVCLIPVMRSCYMLRMQI